MVNIYGGTFIKRQGYENDGLALCTKKQILKSNIAAQVDVGNVTYRLRSRRSGRRGLKAGAAWRSNADPGANNMLEGR